MSTRCVSSGCSTWLRFADATFSTYKDDSEISRLNRGELALADAHPDVREVLDRCEALRLETDGYFDVRAAAADAIDPSGLVKGWAVDRAAAILDEAGVRNFAVNVAGDMRLRGRAVPEPCWSVGIQHPLEPESIAAVVQANDLAVATSGAYARGDHVLDPHTRRPPVGVLSVTIVGPGARDRGRLRDRGVRDGRGGHPLDRAAARATRR